MRSEVFSFRDRQPKVYYQKQAGENPVFKDHSMRNCEAKRVIRMENSGIWHVQAKEDLDCSS